jgi:hypothetical protein
MRSGLSTNLPEVREREAPAGITRKFLTGQGLDHEHGDREDDRHDQRDWNAGHDTLEGDRQAAERRADQ